MYFVLKNILIKMNSSCSFWKQWHWRKDFLVNYNKQLSEVDFSSKNCSLSNTLYISRVFYFTKMKINRKYTKGWLIYWQHNYNWLIILFLILYIFWFAFCWFSKDFLVDLIDVDSSSPFSATTCVKNIYSLVMKRTWKERKKTVYR